MKKELALLAIMLAFIACVSGGCEGSEEEGPVNRTAYIRNVDGTVIVVEVESILNWNDGLIEIEGKNGEEYRTGQENVLIVGKRGKTP